MLSTFFFWIGELDHSFPCQLWSNWLDWIISCHGKNVNKIKCTLCDKTALSNFSFSLSPPLSHPPSVFFFFFEEAWQGQPFSLQTLQTTSQQLLVGLLRNLILIFMVLGWWILKTLVIPRLLTLCHHEADICGFEYSLTEMLAEV